VEYRFRFFFFFCATASALLNTMVLWQLTGGPLKLYYS
jgi:hypothetical protein